MAESGTYQSWVETKIAEMGFWLDSYDDIFSDFDPRPFAKRQMSDDFISEVRKRYKENPKGNFEVSFYLPKNLRDAKTETIVKKRLREYFAFERKTLSQKIDKKRKLGVLYFASGAALLAIEVMVADEYPQNKFGSLAGILLVPAGWFSIWNSLELFLHDVFEQGGQKEFFEKMAKCEYIFGDLEDAKKKLEEPNLAQKQ